jgi:hypothetical protein
MHEEEKEKEIYLRIQEERKRKAIQKNQIKLFRSKEEKQQLKFILEAENYLNKPEG